MPYPSWLPPPVAAEARAVERAFRRWEAKLDEREQATGVSHAGSWVYLDAQRASARRLAVDPDMQRVWRTLLRRNRQTRRYQFPAVPVDTAGLNPELAGYLDDPDIAQWGALAMFYREALRAYWPTPGARRRPLRQHDIAAFSARVERLADDIAGAAGEALRLGYGAGDFFEIEARLRWFARTAKAGIAGRPVLRRGSESEGSVLTFLAALTGTTVRLFGRPLYGCCAIVASVLLEQPVTEARVRRAMARTPSLTTPESAP
ncbi:MAG TPA: hypothetical protein VE993_12510 [Stellaceae bacterium]|nr:hypothetical protein [Stellaceae bacterium]